MPDHVTIVHTMVELSLSPPFAKGGKRGQQAATVALTLFTGHEGPVPALTWSPSGDFLAVASGTFVRVWDVSSLKDPVFTFNGHTATVRTVAWAPDGSLCVASGGDDSVLWMWEFELARRAFRLVPGHRDLRTSATGFRVQHEVHSIAWDSHGRYLVAGGERVLRVFERGGGLGLPRHFLASHPTPVRLVAWSPDGEFIASACDRDNAIYIWEAASGALLFPYQTLYQEVTHLPWSPDGVWLAAAYADGPVQVWNPRTLQTAVWYTGHTSRIQALAWSPGGRLLLTGDSGGQVHVWEARTGRLALQYVAQPLPAPQVLALAWSPDGKRVAVGTADKTMQIVRIPDRLVELVRP